MAWQEAEWSGVVAPVDRPSLHAGPLAPVGAGRDGEPAVVIDAGSRSLRLGLAGDSEPLFVGASVLRLRGKPHPRLEWDRYRPVSECLLAVGDAALSEEEAAEGGDATRLDGAGRRLATAEDGGCLRWPFANGIVTNWDEWEELLTHASREAGTPFKDRTLMLTERGLNPSANREKMTQIAFEEWEASDVTVSIRDQMCLYAAGRTVGSVVRMGRSGTVVSAFYDYMMPHTVRQFPNMGSAALDAQIATCLAESGDCEPLTGRNIETVREAFCTVSVPCTVQGAGAAAAGGGGGAAGEEERYTLPDGRVVDVPTGQLATCVEMTLFTPSKASPLTLPAAIREAVFKVDVEVRDKVASGLVLAGGLSTLPGLRARLATELAQNARSQNEVYHIAPDPIGADAPWLGASIYASLSEIGLACMSKEMYDENGPSLVHRKCY